MSIRAPANLPELVRSAFASARSHNELTFFPTEVAVLEVNSIPFQLRFSPSLANKPKPPPPTTTSNSTPAPAAGRPSAPPFSTTETPQSADTTTTTTPNPPISNNNPFENPHPALLITPLATTHNLVLNKFAIVPEHFILATRHFQPQTHLLGAADLEATFSCIRAYDAAAAGTWGAMGNAGGKEQGGTASSGRKNRGLFAFFNSGPHSGASQPHRHLQLLPIERMRDGLPPDRDDSRSSASWNIAVETGHDGQGSSFPFRTFSERLPSNITAGNTLREIYLRLYRAACAAMDVELGREAAAQEDGEALISYNLALTRHVMICCPRVSEGAAVRRRRGTMTTTTTMMTINDDGLKEEQEDEEVGFLAANGTVLAGTALVKSQAEWDALRGDPAQLEEILRKIGLPS